MKPQMNADEHSALAHDWRTVDESFKIVSGDQNVSKEQTTTIVH